MVLGDEKSMQIISLGLSVAQSSWQGIYLSLGDVLHHRDGGNRENDKSGTERNQLRAKLLAFLE